jgi:hypothetical protein
MGSSRADTPRKIMYFREDDTVPRFGVAISYEGKLWLAPQWNAGPTEGTLSPTRIISLSGLPVGSPSQRRSDTVLILSTPLSRRVLEGHREAQDPLVIEQPQIVLNDADMP